MKKNILILFIFIIQAEISFSQDFLNVKILDNWTDTNIIKGPGDARYSDCWGFKQNGKPYAVIGSTEGTHVFKIENKKLIEVDFKEGKFSSLLVQHRDFKVYKNYLYGVCDEGSSSLQIFDLTYLPDSIHKVYDSDEFFTICHNIFIDTLQAKLYCSGSNGFGMTILDISNPIVPVLSYEFTQVNYVHDCYVVNDTAFLNCGFDGLHIYNFSGTIPIQLGVLDFYVEQGYNHSGWLSKDKKKYVFTDETQGKRIKYCAIDDLSQIKVDNLFGTKNYLDYVPHNPFIVNDFVFVAYYNEGLRIFDLNQNPIKEVAFYDTFWQETSYKLNGAWGVYVFEEEEYILISDRQNGLFLFHFPIHLFRAVSDKPISSNFPFIDENSYIIFPHQNQSSYFTIYSLDGKKVYEMESFLNWVNIPLFLNAGGYVYGIYNENKELIYSGKFVQVN